MVSRGLVILTAIALSLVLASAATAQYESSDKSPIGVRLATFLPSSGSVSKAGSTWLGPMLDFHTTFDEYDRPTSMISIGWFGKDEGSTKATCLPITATYMKHFGKDTYKGWYAGGGAGLYKVKFNQYMPWPARPDERSGTKFGVHLVGGVAFGAWFAEVRYNKTSSLDTATGGADFSGLTLSVGSHFAL